MGGSVAHENPTGPGVGYVATTTMSGTKTDTPITEIPNSIYVVTKQLMADQQPQSVVEALRYTPGVYAESEGTYGNGNNQTGTSGSGIFQRGFATKPFVDGLLFVSSASNETAFLERVEAVNGPASVMYGQVYPGGMIAMELKKPTDDPLHQVSVGFGNWNRYEATLDVSDKISKSGNIRYRIAAIGVTQGTQTNYLHYHRVGVLPSFTWDIDHNTSLTLLGMYMYTPGDGTGEISQYPALGTLIHNNEFPEIPRSNFLGTPNWNTSGETDKMFEYQFSHHFNKNISFMQTFRWNNSDQTMKTVYSNQDYSTLSHEETVSPWLYQGSSNSIGLDSHLVGKLNIGQVKNTWVVGSDFREYSYRNNVLYDDYNVATINVYNPQPNYTPCLSFTSSSCAAYKYIGVNSYFQEGVYFQDQLKWNSLSVILGGREDWVTHRNNTSYYDSSDGSAGSSGKTPQKQNAFTWRAGLIYNFKFGLAPYFSYSTSFVPQTSTDWKGNTFSPLTGNQLEAGIKYKVPNRDILLTASAFRINEDHYLISDLVHTGYSSDAGRVRSQGFEISANANITKNLRAIASYSYTDIRFAKTNKTTKRFDEYSQEYYGSAISEQGMSVPQVPRNMFSAFFDYSLPNNIANGFGFNWGIRYVGFTYVDNVESFKTRPYVLFDLGAHYDFGKAIPALKGLKAQLSISNLTNKYYVTSCQTNICYLGQGRRVYGNLTYSW
ncbi:TonB-dependent siderophore receptor [Acetobacter okinawensis]|uniref:TonB-dependent siderophore receptor n=1 Tax=Acetobacter okinawensis TaxID=1076594 RepID=UPI0039ED1D12